MAGAASCNTGIAGYLSSNTMTTLAGSGAGSSIDGVGTSAGFYLPWGLATTSTNTIYIADYGGQKIRMISSSGVVSTVAGSGAFGYVDGVGTNAEFYSPLGVAVTSTVDIYIADYNNNRIRHISSSGEHADCIACCCFHCFHHDGGRCR